MRKTRIAALLMAWIVLGEVLLAQTSVELRQDQTRYNLRSTTGAMPISHTPGTPAGSDGRAPGPAPGPLGTPSQFQGAVGFSGGVNPQQVALGLSGSMAANADLLNLPRAASPVGTRLIMTSARVGSPFLSRNISFLFGAIIPVPDTDEYGVLLSTTNPTTGRTPVEPEAYWLDEPYTSTSHDGKPYYWSRNARRVYGVNPGPVPLTWRRLNPGSPVGSPSGVTTVSLFGNTYTLFTKTYFVSASPVKSVRQIYWTEGDFLKTGKRVNVPDGRVGDIKIVYNSDVQERVPTAYQPASSIVADPSQRLEETRTIWFDRSLSSINAYNSQGRVFLEILGDTREDGTRIPLGIEIVDIVQAPTPNDVTTELGELLTAYQNDNPDDSDLFPDPIENPEQQYVFRHAVTGQDRFEFFATRETVNLNDLQVHWLENGVAGIRWPFRFVRYQLVWPSDVAKYSHYVRPLVATDAEAKRTAVALPPENAPFLQYQDALDQARGKMTERFSYYTFLSTEYPAHRALIRFVSGDNIRFERVFSWLDTALRSNDFADSVAENLESWNRGSGEFTWPDPLQVPRTVSATVYVGDRVSAPAGEDGSGFDAKYLAGYIVKESGDSFHPVAYVDPFAVGFDLANAGAIIPVNAIPGDNLLEVIWFRKNQVQLDLGFKSVLWPSVHGRYTIEWPVSPSEIVLASNDGSGGLPSLQAKGSIYFENDRTKAGYNPNEEHALMQGGQAFALRDDLNVTQSGPNYTSHPHVLLDYVESDGRPAMKVFKVLREKPSAGLVFDFTVKAGTIMQAPMPLPLLDVPFAPKLAGQPQISLNQEIYYWTIATSTKTGDEWRFTTTETHGFRKHFLTVLQDPSNPAAAPVWFMPSQTGSVSVRGYLSVRKPYTLTAYTGSQPVDPTHHRFALANPAGLAVGDKVFLINSSNNTDELAEIDAIDATAGFVEIEFVSDPDSDAEGSTSLVQIQTTGSAGAYNSWRLAWEPLPLLVSSSDLRTFYASFTYQDRKGNVWVYRGPHDAADTASLSMRFYYKTLPGFYFPSLAFNNQPPTGTITPYLRTLAEDGNYVGDPVHGNQDGNQVGDPNALSINYHPIWPPNTPVLDMAETLTLPKRGLPAVRGQTSLQILYQQSQVVVGESSPSAVLHDPTREKEFKLGDPSGSAVLGKIPDSIATSNFRGRTYFPNLAPHLVERFFLDPNRGTFGALVFKGQFVDAPVGDKYVLLNVLGPGDLAALKALCLASDPKKAVWDAAIDGLETTLETFVENPSKPGTFIPFVPANTNIGPGSLSKIINDDTAVDSYALTAIGPGTGYLTLIAGNGSAFTPEAEPVSVHVIRVAKNLYRGEVNIVESSNPLNERLTLQQVVDLAGQSQDYRFEWLIASPVDGLPPTVYVNTPRVLMGDGSWSHLAFPVAADNPIDVPTASASRITFDVTSSVPAVGLIPFHSATQDANDPELFSFEVSPPHRLIPGVPVTMRTSAGVEFSANVTTGTDSDTVVVRKTPNQPQDFADTDLVQLFERSVPATPQSYAFRQFDVPGNKSYSQLWVSLDLDNALGAKVYIDGQHVLTLNTGVNDSLPSAPPASLTPLTRSFLLNSTILSGGVPQPDGSIRHTIVVAFHSVSTPGTFLTFNARVEAFESVDNTSANWIPIDSVRFPDGVRAILGGTADVRSLADNYVIMRYQARNNSHASWVSDPSDATKNIAWSQWTTPALAEGWIKRVLKGINPFNQRVTDLFNNQINTDVSLIQQAGQRWEGDVSLNLDTINDSGLIEIYETVLNRGKMISIGGGINFGPANDALLLAAGYLNDLYMMLGNEAWADAANPTIGIGTKDNTYGDIATALFSFRGQLPTLLEEELALLRGRDDFLLPGVELRPVYNRLPWNFTRGIDAGEVIYSLNYNILDQNTDGKVDAADAQKLFPQGHGDAYGHYLTSVKNYYLLLLDPNFDWVPRIEAVNVLGKPVSVDYQDERKLAAAAASLARAGKQTFDLTWRRDFKAGSGQGWQHMSATRDNTTSRNLPTTRHWGSDHWASRTGMGAYMNWIVGNAILPDVDPDPSHTGSIQQVDRTTVPELRELPATAESLQAAMDAAEGNLTPLGVPTGIVPFDLNPLSIANGTGTSHFEQIYARAKEALKNALTAFNDAKDVTRLLRSEGDSLADFRTEVAQQELAYNNSLIEIYGTPYPEDMGPGKVYATGYTGPDYLHYMYVDTKEITFGSLLTPATDYEWRIDVQTFPSTWLTTTNKFPLHGDGISDFSFIKQARTSPVDGVANPQSSYSSDTNLFVTYNLKSHGFFDKPSTYVGKRSSPGRAQQAISDIVKARNAAYEAFYNADAAKYDLDYAIQALGRKQDSWRRIYNAKSGLVAAEQITESAKLVYDIYEKYSDETRDVVEGLTKTVANALPRSFVAGLAVGGDLTAPARAAIEQAGATVSSVTDWVKVIAFSVVRALEYANDTAARLTTHLEIEPEEFRQELRDLTAEMRDAVYLMNDLMMPINTALQELDDAQREYQALLAEGERVQAEREIFRQRAAAIIQGFRTRDAAFRIFRNEKLERYKTLFDLAARYTYMAVQAFDYETGLLHTKQGKEFIQRVVNARALGVMTDGEPQFAGSNTGDPGLSSVMAEMLADWSVLKGRLGIKNPDAYGTTASLRLENFRILPGSEGDEAWKDVLLQGRKANLLDDSDVRRYCMQIDARNGLPVPGIILEFGTTIADGLNLFGKPLAAGDHAFSPASFATKIFHIGVALEGYKGMDDPNANGSAVGEAGAASPIDPNLTFLDPDALSATPYIYLIPVGLDSMRSPPLGDVSVIRTWSVDDVSIPLPFNIGGSDFSNAKLYQGMDSLTEPLFTVRKHQPFRPVSSANIFGTLVVYWTGGELERTQYASTRLIGRSVWNSKWKLIIPGRTLLNNPNEGLDRLVRTVKDVKFYFNTYSYSGN